MQRIIKAGLAVLVTLAFAACASTPQAGGSNGAAACSGSSAAGTVTVTIKDSAYSSTTPSAKVGQVITFKNNDTDTQHSATLDNGACDTGLIDPGASHGLTFSVAGTYQFHCTVHPTMTGTFTITS